MYPSTLIGMHVHVCSIMLSSQTVDMANLQERLQWLMDISSDNNLGQSLCATALSSSAAVCARACVQCTVAIMQCAVKDFAGWASYIHR